MAIITQEVECYECEEKFDLDFEPADEQLETECPDCGERLTFEYDPAKKKLFAVEEIEDEDEEEEDDEADGILVTAADVEQIEGEEPEDV